MNGKRVVAVALVALAAVLVAACQKQTSVTEPATQTIAPAAAQPAPNTGTDQMTGTVEVEDGRSEADGGVLTSDQKPQGASSSTSSKKSTGKAATKKTKSKK